MEQATVCEPFWWAVHIPEKSGVGKTLALLLHSLFTSGSDFGSFLDVLPHGDSQHPYDGYACFKCMLKAMHLATYVAKDATQLLALFDEICDKWSIDLSVGEEPLYYLLMSLDSWAKVHQDFGCDDRFYRLFRFDTHVKWGCYHCKNHFSSSASQYMFEVGGRTLELYLTQLTTEIWRECSICKVQAGYDRVSLTGLPDALIFANAGSPGIHVNIREAQYILSSVIPKVSELVSFVLSGDGWLEYNLEGGARVESPARAVSLTGVMEYAFYSKI